MIVAEPLGDQGQVALEPARPVPPALRQRQARAEAAQLRHRQLRVADLRVALHHVGRAVRRQQLVDAPARIPGPGVVALDRALGVGRLDELGAGSGSGSSPPCASSARRTCGCCPVSAVAESMRKWRGPFLTTSVSPRSAASAAGVDRVPLRLRAVVEADRVPDRDLGVGRRALELEDLAVAGVVQIVAGDRLRRSPADSAPARTARPARRARHQGFTLHPTPLRSRRASLSLPRGVARSSA